MFEYYTSVILADRTPCISPLPQDGHLQDKSSPSLGLIQEESEVINSIMGKSVANIFFLTISHYKILEIDFLKSRVAANAFIFLVIIQHLFS